MCLVLTRFLAAAMNAITFDQFLAYHKPQLQQIYFPEELYHRLYSKLCPSEVFDAGENFDIREVHDENSGSVKRLLVAKKSLAQHGDVFLVDHAWSNDGNCVARKQLEKHDHLLQRMEAMMCLDDVEEATTDYTNSQLLVCQQQFPACDKDFVLRALKHTEGDLINTFILLEAYIEGGSSDFLSMEKEDVKKADVLCSFEEFKSALLHTSESSAEELPNDNQIDALYQSFLKSRSSSGGKQTTARYSWEDNEDGTLTVRVIVPPSCKKQDVNSNITSTSWSLHAGDTNEAVLSGDFYHAVRPSECVWSFDKPGVLCMDIQKQSEEEETWPELLKGEVSLSPVEVLMKMDREKMKKELRLSRVMDKMWKYNHTYQINNQPPVWYVMDEVGSALTHSDTPNFMCSPFVCVISGVTYCLLWALSHVAIGDTCTRNCLPAIAAMESKVYQEIRKLALSDDPSFDPVLFAECKTLASTLKASSARASFDLHIDEIDGHLITQKTDSRRKIYLSGCGLTLKNEMPPFTTKLANADVIIQFNDEDVDLKRGQIVKKLNCSNPLLRKHSFCSFVHDHFGLADWLPESYILPMHLPGLLCSHYETAMAPMWIVKSGDREASKFKPFVTTDLKRIIRVSETRHVVASKVSCLDQRFKGKCFVLSYGVIVLSLRPLEIRVLPTPDVRLGTRSVEKEAVVIEHSESPFISARADGTLINPLKSSTYQSLRSHMVTKWKRGRPDASWESMEKRMLEIIGDVLCQLARDECSTFEANSFSLYGFDFLLDGRCSPRLVDIHTNVSFCDQSELAAVAHVIADYPTQERSCSLYCYCIAEKCSSD